MDLPTSVPQAARSQQSLHLQAARCGAGARLGSGWVGRESVGSGSATGRRGGVGAPGQLDGMYWLWSAWLEVPLIQ